MQLRATNVSKSFGNTKALKNVDFCADFGEVHALLGENGAGKSTFLKLLSGVLQPDTGGFSLDSQNISFRNPMEAIKMGIGTVYQELSLIPDLTVAQNLLYNNWEKNKLSFISTAKMNAKAQQLLDKFELDDIKTTDMVKDLTLTQKQIIEIVKVLGRNPQVIVLDEATSALTDERVRWILELCSQLASEGKLVLFISHRLNEITNVCKHVTVLRNGINAGVRKMSETNEDELISMMIGRSINSYFPNKISNQQDEILLKGVNLQMETSLHDVNFEIQKGTVVGLGGLAGQGQIPFFYGLFGISKFSAGQLIYNGKNITVNNTQDALKYGIFLLPEDRATQGLIPSMLIRENISLIKLDSLSRFGFIKRKTEREKAQEIIDILNIKCSTGEETVSSLSGGNQQKVVFGKLLLAEPKILLLHDPTRGVDVGTKAEIYLLLRDWASKGNSVIWYSTDLDELVNVCDNVIIMYDKTIAASLEENVITKENILKASMGKRIHT
jgi:ribose transport system ATP-binding protein